MNTKASSRVGYFIRRILAFGLDYLIVNRVCIMATALVYGMMNHGEVIILSDLSSVPLPAMCGNLGSDFYHNTPVFCLYSISCLERADTCAACFSAENGQ